MEIRTLRYAAFAAVATLALATVVHAQSFLVTQDMPATTDDTIIRCAVDGSSESDYLAGAAKNNPLDLALDQNTGRVFWIEANGDGTHRIQMGKMRNPNHLSTVLDGLTDPRGLAVDSKSGFVYYIDGDSIFRTRHDGTRNKKVSNKVEASGLDVGQPESLAIDSVSRTIFWADSANDWIASAKFKRNPPPAVFIASSVELGIDLPSDVAVDHLSGFLYWTDRTLGTLNRISLDGSDARVLHDALDSPSAVAPAVYRGEVYWVEGSNRISRSNFDGDQMTEMFTGEGLGGLALIDLPLEDLTLNSFGRPGSLLMFPYVNTNDGRTLITITNTNRSYVYCGGGVPDIFEGTVRLEFRFVYGDFCQVADRQITLTPADTYSVFAEDIGLQDGEEGWLMVFAIGALDFEGEREAIDYDWLVGSAQVYLPNDDVVWGYDAYSFRSRADLIPFGRPTDSCGHRLVERQGPLGINHNDAADFDGDEYDRFPMTLTVPRILEQDGTVSSFLAVMATERLEESTVPVRIFNNNEDLRASGSFDLVCHAFGDLADPDGPFNFLAVNDLLGEPDDNGFPEREDAGWMHMWIDEDRFDYDTPGILAVFAQIQGENQWVSGNNVWKGPALFEEFPLLGGRLTRFPLDLE